MELYAGIDLHANNNYMAIIDESDTRIYKRKLPNLPDVILAELEPFKKDISEIVVESTFNWYWLVDLLMDTGDRLHLANPAAIQKYKGPKHSDDNHDAFWLAHMLRLNILPEGYGYFSPLEVKRSVKGLYSSDGFSIIVLPKICWVVEKISMAQNYIINLYKRS